MPAIEYIVKFHGHPLKWLDFGGKSVCTLAANDDDASAFGSPELARAEIEQQQLDAELCSVVIRREN